MIDFHNHLIPGVDDGAADVEQALAGIAEMRDQGVHTLIATPHLSGELTESPERLAAALEEIDRGWETLLGAAGDAGMVLHRGCEVMLDTPAPDFSDARVRLAGTPFVLVEFPFMTVPPFAASALFELKMRGWTPVLAHPERYHNAMQDLSDALEWSRVGALLQVNSGSLLGRYGEPARRLAWRLLEEGMVSYLSSDYHARGGCHSAAARDQVAARGAEQAEMLTEVNPARLLAGEAPLPVQPLPQARSVWQRLMGR